LGRKELEVQALLLQLQEARAEKELAERRRTGGIGLACMPEHVAARPKPSEENTLIQPLKSRQAVHLLRPLGRPAELADHAEAATQELASSLTGRYEQQRQTAARLAAVHGLSLDLLAAFQAQGYEVASGLDALQVQDAGGSCVNLKRDE
jgi:hypothetical protein